MKEDPTEGQCGQDEQVVAKDQLPAPLASLIGDNVPLNGTTPPAFVPASNAECVARCGLSTPPGSQASAAQASGRRLFRV